MLQSKGQNHNCPTMGPGGYITCGVVGVPNASEQGTKSEKPHKRADGHITPAVWQVPIASEQGKKISIAPQVGLVAT